MPKQKRLFAIVIESVYAIELNTLLMWLMNLKRVRYILSKQESLQKITITFTFF